MKSDIKIFLADDDTLMIKGLSLLLKSDKSIEIVGTAADGEKALDQILFTKPDMVILDIEMPKRNGLSVLRELIKNNINVKALFLTVYSDSKIIQEAVSLNTDGFILKENYQNEILEAINRIRIGEKYFSKELIKFIRG